jgi:hypothetical protein
MAVNLPRAKRRFPTYWVLSAAAVLIVTTGAALYWLSSVDLTPVARQALKTSLPGAQVDVQDVRMDAPGELVFSNLVIADPVTGRELVRLERGKAVFGFEDLARRQIGELRLENPLVRISPGWSGVLPEMEAAGAPLGLGVDGSASICPESECDVVEGKCDSTLCITWHCESFSNCSRRPPGGEPVDVGEFDGVGD